MIKYLKIICYLTSLLYALPNNRLIAQVKQAEQQLSPSQIAEKIALARLKRKQAEQAKQAEAQAFEAARKAAQYAALAELEARQAEAEAEQAKTSNPPTPSQTKPQAAKDRQEEQALAAAYEANRQSALAELKVKEATEKAKEADQERKIAIREKIKARRIKGLSLAQSVAIKSLDEKDSQVQGLLAREAFLLNLVNDGPAYDALLYDAVYNGLLNLENEAANPEFNRFDQVPEGATKNGAVLAIVAMPFNNGKSADEFILSTGSSGWLLKWKFKTYINRQEKYAKENKPEALVRNINNRVYRTMDITPDGRFLARAGDEPFVEVYDLDKNTTTAIDVHNRSRIWSLVMLPKTVNNTYGFISVGDDRKMRYTSIKGENSSILVDSLPTRITSIGVAVNAQRRLVAGVGNSPLVYVWDMDAKGAELREFRNPFNAEVIAGAVAIDPLGEFLAAGYEDGSILIWDLKAYEANPAGYLPFRNKAHRSKIEAITFSKDGFYMAVGSTDKTATLWLLRDNRASYPLSDPRYYPYRDTKFRPIVLANHDSWVMSVAFSNDGKHLVTGTQNGSLQIWEVDPINYANRLCGHLRSNLSNAEWRKLIGSDGENDNDPFISTPNGERRPFNTCEGKAQRP